MEEEQPRRLAESETIYCEGCYENRPVGDFLDVESDWDPTLEKVATCRRCRTEGPPRADKLGALLPFQRRAIIAVGEGKDLTQAARAAGMPRAELVSLLSPRNPNPVRRAFQIMLEEQGLGAKTIVQIYKEAAKANRVAWNPKEEHFEEFADHNVRLRVGQQLSKHHELEHPREDAKSQGGGVSVVINTNLGDGKDPKTVGGMRAVSTAVSDDGKTLTVEAGGEDG